MEQKMMISTTKPGQTKYGQKNAQGKDSISSYSSYSEKKIRSSSSQSDAITNMLNMDTLPQDSYSRQTVFVNGGTSYETRFTCLYNNCNRVFNKSSSLIVHHMRHKDIRPFQCNICQRSFTQSGTLRRHQRGVHNLEIWYRLTMYFLCLPFVSDIFNQSTNSQTEQNVMLDLSSLNNLFTFS